MPNAGMQLDGARQLRRALKQAGDDLEHMKDTMSGVAGIVAGRAIATAPRRSGRLAGTIRTNRAAARASVLAGRASVPYAGVINYGWPARGIRASLWMNHAATGTETEWVDYYRKGVQVDLDKVKGI